MHIPILLILVLISTSCQEAIEKPIPYNLVFNSRESHVPIYRAKAPKEWIRQDLTPEISLTDTTKPIGEFFIEEGPDRIRITLHTFPTYNFEDRIPPAAQTMRWKKQFQSLEPAATFTAAESFGGYSGLMLEATGQIDGKQTSILAWSMQLAAEHFQTLSQQSQQSQHGDIYKHMLADYTIKAIGAKALMEKHKDDIVDFAHSFELIHDIPMPQ